MPTTINLTKGGSIVGTSDTSQAAARDEADGTSITQDAASALGVQYFKSSGRGGGTFRYTRSFLTFNTSGITGTVTAATLNIESESTHNTADIIAIRSLAFGGINATDDLVNGDFDSVDFSTAYSSEVSSWNTNGSNNAISLNSNAFSAIQSQNNFICAIVDHDSDFQDTDSLSGDGNQTVGIDFSGTITLVVTEAGTGYSHDINGVAAANIGKVNALATGNIGKINTVVS